MKREDVERLLEKARTTALTYTDHIKMLEKIILNNTSSLTTPDAVPVGELMARYDASEIIREWLIGHGFDGLYMPGECACLNDDLFPCGNVCPDCSPGYLCPCDCGDHDFHVGPGEWRDRNG